MRRNILPILGLTSFLFVSGGLDGQSPTRTDGAGSPSGNLIRTRVTATRIIRLSDTTGTYIKHPEYLLQPGNGQADLSSDHLTYLVNDKDHKASLILDFGTELQGAIQIITGIQGNKPPIRLHIRFGESVAEALSVIGEGATATNDHAMRDFELTLPWLGRIETGNSGFRFVNIEVLGDKAHASIKEISALAIRRDLPYLGSFRCNDEMLNAIWQTGARTVHLNMQEYLWDGIKRDRLVWVGDMHPEVSTILSVFGANEVVPKSLDLIRDITPVTEWMNGISSYSMWWILIQRDYYLYTGNLAYLKSQKTYATALLQKLCSMVDVNGREKLDGNRFLDWPSSGDKKAIDAGYQGLLLMTLRAGEEICKYLDDSKTEALCRETASRMGNVTVDGGLSKQAAALLALAGLENPEEAQKVILADGAHRFSTFYGFYMLKVLALAGRYDEALDIIREYWGDMIRLGATTFWEDFNIDWMTNAGRIDELPQPGKVDVHGTYGDYCYKGYRHSFCHGWASGPTSWLTSAVLGVQVMEPGCRKVRIEPHLGDLQWVEGTFPTPYGVITIHHERQPDGTVKTSWKGPGEVEVIIEPRRSERK
jgi:alpha-L-rhamnosidase